MTSHGSTRRSEQALAPDGPAPQGYPGGHKFGPVWKSALILLGCFALLLGSLSASAAAPARHSRPKAPAVQPPTSPEMAAYQKQMSETIGRRWYEVMQAHADEVTAGSSVKIRFYLRPEGSIRNMRVLAGQGAYRRLADFSAAALLEAKLAPMPAAVRAGLPQPRNSMEVDFTFHVK